MRTRQLVTLPRWLEGEGECVGKPTADEIAYELSVRMENYPSRGGYSRDTLGIIKRGKRTFRLAMIRRIFRSEDDPEVKGGQLCLEGWANPAASDTPIREQPSDQSWHCSLEEGAILREFLDENLPRGDYRLVDVSGDLSQIYEMLSRGPLSTDALRGLLEEIATNQDLSTAFVESEIGRALSESVEIARRRKGLENLRALVNDASTIEQQLQTELVNNLWIFGGEYVELHERRELTTDSRVDIPLVRGDGTLQIVELKRPSVAELVKEYRGVQAGSDINYGTGQLMNYLLDLDEDRNRILNRFKVDTRRSTGLLLIGNSSTLKSYTQEETLEAIRTFNSYLSRVTVLTYDQLLENASRMLDFNPQRLAADKPVPTQGRRR